MIAKKKRLLHLNTTTGENEIIHFQTEAGAVLCSDGKTLADVLNGLTAKVETVETKVDTVETKVEVVEDKQQTQAFQVLDEDPEDPEDGQLWIR